MQSSEGGLQARGKCLDHLGGEREPVVDLLPGSDAGLDSSGRRLAQCGMCRVPPAACGSCRSRRSSSVCESMSPHDTRPVQTVAQEVAGVHPPDRAAPASQDDQRNLGSRQPGTLSQGRRRSDHGLGQNVFEVVLLLSTWRRSPARAHVSTLPVRCRTSFWSACAASAGTHSGWRGLRCPCRRGGSDRFAALWFSERRSLRSPRSGSPRACRWVMILASVVASSGKPTLPSSTAGFDADHRISVSLIAFATTLRARRSPRFPRLRMMAVRIATGSFFPRACRA